LMVERVLHRRAKYLILLGIVAWFIVQLKLFQIQIVTSEVLKVMAWKQENEVLDIEARRGTIYDRHGFPVASSIPMTSQAGFLEGRGLLVLRRIFPYREIMGRILGMVGYNGRGQEGIEAKFDEFLRGRDGRMTRPLMGSGRICTVRPAQIEEFDSPGNELRLTIDSIYQALAQVEAAALQEESNAKWAGILLMRPATGEILAAATSPVFDPDNPEQHGSSANPLWSNAFEPGSSFKIVVLAAALEERTADKESVIDCENGIWDSGRRKWHDTKPIGKVTLAEAVARSSNIAAVKLGIDVGWEVLAAKARSFGFGQTIGVGLHAEADGLIPSPTKRRWVSVEAVAIGHEVTVTGLQLLNAYCAVANGGKLVQPRLTLGSSESGEADVIPMRPALSRSDAERLTELLEGVVREGTGINAQHPLLSVAGKTGTAQKADPGGSGYRPGAYISTFAGFFPSKKPTAAMLVIVDEPEGAYYAGLVCAPVFKRMLDRILASPGGCLYPELAAALSTTPRSLLSSPAVEDQSDSPSA